MVSPSYAILDELQSRKAYGYLNLMFVYSIKSLANETYLWERHIKPH